MTFVEIDPEEFTSLRGPSKPRTRPDNPEFDALVEGKPYLIPGDKVEARKRAGQIKRYVEHKRGVAVKTKETEKGLAFQIGGPIVRRPKG